MKIKNLSKIYKNKYYEVKALDNINIDFGKTGFVFILGESGSGKSTLLNRLDKNLNLKTNEISLSLNRGKHTTRHVELLQIFDGLVADTPGFSAITFNEMSASDIRDNFIEFNLYRHNCEYKDCMHNSEINCEIKNQVLKGNILKSRYENYLKFIKE